MSRRRKVCASCDTFQADIMTPVGDGAIALCYVCAHFVAVHGVTVKLAFTKTCACDREEIYPAHVVARYDAIKRGTVAVPVT